MLSSRFLVALSVGLFISVTASASPIDFDGNIDGDDSYYATVIDLGGNEAVIPDNLDIKSVNFDLYDGYFWMGLEVHGGPVATDGGTTSISDMTLFYGVFQVAGSDDVSLIIILDDGAVSNVLLDGTELVYGTHYEAMLGSDNLTGGLEIKIIDGRLLSLTNFTFFGQLDDTGWGNDDQIFGSVDIPEPVTLTLIALGIPLALIRRRCR